MKQNVNIRARKIAHRIVWEDGTIVADFEADEPVTSAPLLHYEPSPEDTAAREADLADAKP